MRLDSLTPVIEAQPGSETTCRVRVTNDRPGPASYSVSVHGMGRAARPVDVPGEPLEAGGVLDLEIPVPVPSNLAAGSHSVAIEVRSNRADETHALVDMQVNVGSLDRVLLHVEPDTIRGGRTARFVISVSNRRNEPTHLELDGFGPDLEVTIDEPRLTIAPGEEIRVPASVRGPQHRTGDPLLHVLTVTGRGGASPSHATASFRQRATFPGKLRRAIAIVTVLCLWLGVVGVGAWWWIGRNHSTATSALSTKNATDGSTPANGSGSGAGTGTGSGSDTGSGAGTGTGSGSGGGAGGSGAAAGAPAVPTVGAIEGKVRTPSPADSLGVKVTLSPIVPGQTPTAAPFVLATGPGQGLKVVVPEGEPTKIWPARFGLYQPTGTPLHPRTNTVNAIETTIGQPDGRFAFPPQPLQQSYEVSIAKEGFDTKSIVVVPHPDGTPVELDLTLVPAKGALGGVVTGPGGPLGGVDLVITDGVLQFKATSSTDPQHLGQWEVLGLSTPGSYTVQATRAGLGTAVIMQRLGNGQQVMNLSIPMHAGVGTITGHVRAGGAPLGGVSISVSNGDVTRTSNSFTEGDIGGFAFPDLPIPGVYVVAVSAAGYITQTREVQLSGNAPGIDFDLTRTSGSIIGVVRSDNGTSLVPLPEVGVTAVRDTLQVRTLTKVAGTPGSFQLDNLPPGDYTVTFAHFSHATKTVLVTVTANGVADLGFVDLISTPGSSLQQTGSFQVDIRRRLLAGGNEPLSDWWVEYSKRPGGTVQRYPATGTAPGSSANIPVGIGTYDLTFRHSGYRDFKVSSLSVGLAAVSVPVEMLQLGQAYGYLYDTSTAPTEPAALTSYSVLGGYSYSILDAGGTPAPGQTSLITDTSAQPAWSSSLNINTGVGLGSGTYQLRIDTPPAGYYIDPTQTLRLYTLNGTPIPQSVSPMRFTIPADSIAQVGPLLVKAEPYPKVSGTITFQPNTPALPAGSTALVSLSCGGAAPVTTTVSATGQTAAYSFSKVQTGTLFGAGRTSGSCTLTATPTVAGRTFLPTSADPFTLSVGVDRTVPLVIVEKGSLAGPVVWIDRGTPTPTAITFSGTTVTITRAAGAVIGLVTATDGSVRQVTDPAVKVTSATNGTWSLDGQVWGTSTYTVTGTQFTQGTFTVTIADTGVTVQGSSTVAASYDAGTGQITLTLDPLPGTINGTVTLESQTPDPAAVSVTATGPATATPTVSILTQTALSYAVTSCTTPPCTTAPAGTWTITVNPPAGYRVHHSTGVTPPPLLSPAGALSPSTTLTELAGVDVSVLQQNRDITQPGTVIKVTGSTYPVVSLALVGTPATFGDLPDPAGYTDTNGDGNYPISNLAVDDADPAGTPVSYALSVDAGKNFSFAEATVTVDNVLVPVVNGTAVFTVRAGEHPAIAVLMPQYGTISGTVTGYNNAVGSPLTIADQLDVSYQLVTAGGVPTGPVLHASAGTGNTFVIAAPAGCYRVVATHPNYQDRSPVQVPADLIVTNPGNNPNPVANTCPTSGGLPTYELQAKKDQAFSTTFGLDAKKAAIALTVLDGATGVSGATVEVRDASNTVVFTGTTGADGKPTTTFTDGTGTTIPELTGSTGLVLWPGSHTVTVRRVVSGFDLSFPVDVTVIVPYGNTLGQRVVAVTAATVSVGGTIDGTNGVTAINSAGRAIDMPTSIIVARTPTVLPSATVNGVPVPNAADENSLVVKPATTATITSPAPPLAGGAAPTTSGTYKFTDLPFGSFTLSFPPAGGYTAPNPVSTTVNSRVTAAVPTAVTYQASDVKVTVTVLSDHGTPGDPTDDTPITNATVSLLPPPTPGGTALSVAHTPSDATGVYSRPAVVPEIGAYQLSVSSPLHTAISGQAIRIVPSATGVQNIPITLALSAVTISGTVSRLDTTGGSALAPPGDATASLYVSGTNTLVAGPVDATSGSFSFAAGTGNYRVQVTAAGYDPATAEVQVTGVTPGGTVSAGALVLHKQLLLSFLVKTSTNAVVDTATITMATATGNTSGLGQVALAVSAGDSMAYTVTKAGYLTTTGTANPAISPNPVTFNPTIVGTAFNNGSSSKSLTMYLCDFSVGVAACDGTSQTATTATAGANYSFAAAQGHWWVKAVNAANKSSAVEIYVLADGHISLDGTNAIATMPAIDIVDAPTAVVATAGPSGVSVTVTWSRGNGLTSQVRLDNGSWVDVGSAQTFSWTTLAPSTTYTVSVRTQSASGVSSPVSTTATTGVVPAPAALALTSTTTSVAATWTAVAGVTYEVRIYLTSGTAGAWGPASSAGAHTFSGLTGATSYTVEVRGTANGFTSTVSSGTTSTA